MQRNDQVTSMAFVLLLGSFATTLAISPTDYSQTL
jgi:hypothetical protein